MDTMTGEYHTGRIHYERKYCNTDHNRSRIGSHPDIEVLLPSKGEADGLAESVISHLSLAECGRLDFDCGQQGNLPVSWGDCDSGRREELCAHAEEGSLGVLGDPGV